MILDPALAGVLIAVAGMPITYLVDVATFVAGLFCLYLMKAVPPPADAQRPSLRRPTRVLVTAAHRTALAV